MLLLLVLSYFLHVMHCSYIPHDVLRLGDHDHDHNSVGGEDPPACDSCCDDAPGDACSDLLEQLTDMERVIKESGCDNDAEGDLPETDQDALCNAVAKNAIASCMMVEDEDERNQCMEQVEQEVNEEDVGVTIDGCECYNFKKIHATILKSVEQSCPEERMPKNGGEWVPYRRIYYAYAMCLYLRRPRWCMWWRRIAIQQAAIANSGGIRQIPLWRRIAIQQAAIANSGGIRQIPIRTRPIRTRPVRPGANCMFCTINLSGANGFFSGITNK